MLLGAIVLGDDNKPVDFCTFLLPASDYAVDDVWDTVGLRGTGSNDIVVDGAFVPAHRALSFNDVTRLACPGQERNPGPLYRIPYGSVFTYAITTPVIGMATGAYDGARGLPAGPGARRVRGGEGRRRPVRPGAGRRGGGPDRRRLAGARAEHGRPDGARPGGEKLPIPLRLRVRRDQVTGTAQSVRAIDMLFENSGGRALKAGTPLQRFWRDAHAGRLHAINDPERALSMFGRGEFGRDVPPGAMF